MQKFINQIKEFCNKINYLYEKNTNGNISLRLIKNITAACDFINDFLVEKNTEKNYKTILQNLENAGIVLQLLSIINANLNIDDLQINTTNKTLLYDIRKDMQSILSMYTKVRKTQIDLCMDLKDLAVNTLFKLYFYTDEKVIENLEEISQECRKYKFIWDTYVNLVDKILAKYVNNSHTNPYIKLKKSIQLINEKNKDFLLSVNINKIKHQNNPQKLNSSVNMGNPYLKTYGLIPVSKVSNLNEIANILDFKVVSNVSLTQFAEICNKHKCDLILVKKLLERGVNYNILDLLDYSTSKKYNSLNTADDGVSIETIERFKNITYISKNVKDKQEFRISYEFVKNKNSNELDKVIIIEQLYKDSYHILSNNLTTDKDSYIIEKNTIKPFLHFVETGSIGNRISNYNTIINKSIISNMFLDVKPDLTTIKEKIEQLNTVDPTYLIFEINDALHTKYKDLAKNIKNTYDFGVVFYSKELVKIFSDAIAAKQNEYIDNNIKGNFMYMGNKLQEEFWLNEIRITSAEFVSSYEREFIKKMHDNFMIEVEDITFDKDKNNTFEIFKKIVNVVLNSIITPKSNLFYDIEFKKHMLEFAKN